MRSVFQLASNFHWIVPGEAARSAQMPAMLLGPLLNAHSVRTLINLRGAHPEFAWWRKEEQVCLKQGVRYLNAMLDSRLLPTPQMLAGLWDCFDRAKGHPAVLIKCAGGQDRTSLAAALYLIERQGWAAMDKAQAQLDRLPRFRKAEQRWLKAFPKFARDASGGAPIGKWVREAYDPHALARWLDKWVGVRSYAGVYGETEATKGLG